jgi:hypothetical protein
LAAFAAVRVRKLREMEGAERDDTQDWLLPAGSAPPLISELEHRVDEALAIAKASEAAVMTVGAAAMDAAEQARRAAELAERAALSAAAASVAPPPVEVAEPPAAEPVPAAVAFEPVVEVTELETEEREVVTAPVEDSFERFSRHADQVLARLREIERSGEPTAP